MNKLSQTLQEKYPHLEVSISPLSKVKQYLILGSDFNSNTREQALSNIESKHKVSDYFDLISATISQIQEPYYVYDLTHSLGNFLQDVELTQGKLGSNKKQVKKDDLIVSRLRSYLQEIAVVQQKDFKQLVSTEYLVYRPKTELMSSNTLMVFALTKSVQTILNYSQYGTEHPRFYEFVFDEMPIPKAVLELNYHIDSIMKEAYKVLESSKALYKEAESLLYESLGLDSKNPLQSILESKITDYHDLQGKSCDDNALSPNYTIATLKESFLKTGRLDAEYYQSKYEDIERFIKNYRGGYLRLTDIVEVVNGSFIPEAFYTQKAQRAYIRIKELSLNAPIKISECIYIKDDFIASNEVIVKENDFVIATTGNTIGKVNLVPKELEGSFISNNTSRLRLIDKNYIPEFIELLLRSMFVQEQIQRNFTQTAQPKISNTSLENILIPKIDSTTQESIAKHIQKSFELRTEAKNLLEKAKSEVESALNNANNGGGGGKGSPYPPQNIWNQATTDLDLT
ncbi:restriction endonuclease subunit S [Helicobacter pullorum]